MLTIPYTSERPDYNSDALDDLHIRIDRLVNYIGEILSLIYHSKVSLGTIGAENEFELNISGIQIPRVRLESRGVVKLSLEFPTRLFYTSIVQLASDFEYFLSDLIKELYWYNKSLTASIERTVTIKDLIEADEMDDLIGKIIEESTNVIISKSYPEIVRKFQNTFHVGIHNKTSPIGEHLVHHFFEIRNIIIHNDGYASERYLTRVENYKNLLGNSIISKYHSVPVDFVWLLQMADDFLKLGDFIDSLVIDKGLVTTRTYKMVKQ